jgi:DNA-binding transcriptional regulator YiaG
MSVLRGSEDALSPDSWEEDANMLQVFQSTATDQGGHPEGETMTPSDFKALRTVLRLTQSQLAGQLKVSRATIDRWERGVSPVPELVAWEVRRLVGVR